MVKRYVLTTLSAVITTGWKICVFFLSRHYILYPLLIVITVGLLSDTYNRLETLNRRNHLTTLNSWLGLRVAPENRCSPYNPEDYPYSQRLERRIVADMGLGGHIYGPYENRYFGSTSETDIEHIVARSEAHDSGLCQASAFTRRAFSEDLLNLTLASPEVNRYRKGDKDAGEWLPDYNLCWFANRVVQVKRRYSLTVDRREADKLKRVLADCGNTWP